VLLTGLAFAALAAPVGAAPLAEVPFQQLPGNAMATCLRATGTPGGLALLGPLSRVDAASDLLAADVSGVRLDGRVRLGAPADCAAAASAPGGASVLAGAVNGARGGEVRAAARDPGGALGAPVLLGDASQESFVAVAAAVAPRGDAVVAWTEVDGDRVRVFAARRVAGGSPWLSELLAQGRGESGAHAYVAAAVDPAGRATVAWSLPLRDRGRIPNLSHVEVARAEPGRSFTVQRLSEPAQDVNGLALAVAPDGGALLAHGTSAGIRAFERPPGAAGFVPLAIPGMDDGPDTFVPRSGVMAAIRDGGGVVVAWRTGFDPLTGGVAAARRESAGPLGPVQVVSRGVTEDDGSRSVGAFVFFSAGVAPPVDPDNGVLRGALAPDGRVLLAWTAAVRESPAVPHVATGTLAGGFGEPQRLGGPLRGANGVAPLFLPGGQAALAWTDNDATISVFYGFPTGGGRLHLAVEGAAAPPEPTVPRLTVRTAGRQRLFRLQPLPVAATCDRACDLRAVVAGGGTDGASLRDAGRAVLRVDRTGGEPPRPLTGRLRVIVHATAPGGQRLARVSAVVHVRHRRSLPVPPPLDLRARRRGNAIVVTWRTAFPARRAYYYVAGRRTRRAQPSDPGAVDLVDGNGRRRFSVRLRPERPAAVRWVAVGAVSLDRDVEERSVLVRVSR
jgi:hypothetical protein